jgi:hypothetical protein
MNLWKVEACIITSFQETLIAAFIAKNYPFFRVQFHLKRISSHGVFTLTDQYMVRK